jgi:hypothetical protein
VERVRRRLVEARGSWGRESGLSGNPIWMRRQMRTRATTRSWYNNGFGAMMRSSSTGMKEAHFTAFAHA